MSYVNNKDADQPAHPCSLISAFVVHSLGSIISIDAIHKQLASEAEQASLSLTWSQTAEDRFSRDVTQIVTGYKILLTSAAYLNLRFSEQFLGHLH